MDLAPVERLGADLEARWCADDYNLDRFPEVATRALADARLPERISADDIIRWALHAATLPEQSDLPARFGQPPLTLHRSRRFYIQALYWLDGSTTIHQHAFSGAFQVLLGSSIETRYEFEVERRFDGHFVLGTLRRLDAALRGRGDITAIRSGPRGLVHSLFHLDRPSVTVVVRTSQDADSGPQFAYAPPGIGFDPFFEEPTRDRALQLVNLLLETGHSELERMVGDLVARSDLHTAYRVLDACSRTEDRQLFARLIERVRDRGAAERFREAFEVARRLAFLYARRAAVREPNGRFLLGVLVNAHRRQDALALVSARATGRDAAQEVAAGLRQLSQVTVKLQTASGPWEPNLLGLPVFSDRLERVLAQVLAGHEAPADDPEVTAFVERIRALPALASLFA